MSFKNFIQHKITKIAARSIGVITATTMIGETIYNDEFESGYIVDGLALSTALPLVMAGVVVGGAVIGGTAGKLLDFVINGIEALNFKNYDVKNLKNAPENHASMQLGGLAGGVFLGFIGNMLAIPTTVNYVPNKVRDWRHELFGNNATNVSILKETPVSPLRQTTAEAVAAKENRWAYPGGAVAYTPVVL